MRTVAECEELFATWLDAHQGIVGRVASSFARTAGERKELEHEMLLQVWRSLPRYAGDAKPSTWIYRVSLNTAISWTRQKQRRGAWEEIGEIAGEGDAPSEAAANREDLALLYAGIRRLPAGERALLLLSLDDVSYREISEITGLTENHVGVALTRARKRLGQVMKGTIDELE